jgi:hypothetical protein
MVDWITSIGGTNLAIICATLFGPVLAVQAQKWLERGRDEKERRLVIFRTLMATRAALVSPTHVEALNGVPVEFYGRGKKLKQINDAWKLYLDHHDVDDPATTSVWYQKKLDLFFDLLVLMSEYLGYSFSKAQLSRDVYSPKAHGEMETEQTIIRRGLVGLFNGQIALPIAVKQFPATEPAPDVQAALLEPLVDAQQPKTLIIAADKDTEKKG